MLPFVFILLALILLLSAVGVLLVKEPVRCALFGALAFIALGLFFIGLGAEFIGLVQLLVNVGAVAILIVFVVLLTRQHVAVTPQGHFIWRFQARVTPLGVPMRLQKGLKADRLQGTSPTPGQIKCPRVTPRFSPTALGGFVTAGLLLAGFMVAVFRSPSLAERTPAELPEGVIARIGEALVSTHLIPLQAVAVLLTAALIGAALFVWDEPPPENPPEGGSEND